MGQIVFWNFSQQKSTVILNIFGVKQSQKVISNAGKFWFFSWNKQCLKYENSDFGKKSSFEWHDFHVWKIVFKTSQLILNIWKSIFHTLPENCLRFLCFGKKSKFFSHIIIIKGVQKMLLFFAPISFIFHPIVKLCTSNQTCDSDDSN